MPRLAESIQPTDHADSTPGSSTAALLAQLAAGKNEALAAKQRAAEWGLTDPQRVAIEGIVGTTFGLSTSTAPFYTEVEEIDSALHETEGVDFEGKVILVEQLNVIANTAKDTVVKLEGEAYDSVSEAALHVELPNTGRHIMQFTTEVAGRIQNGLATVQEIQAVINAETQSDVTKPLAHIMAERRLASVSGVFEQLSGLAQNEATIEVRGDGDTVQPVTIDPAVATAVREAIFTHLQLFDESGPLSQAVQTAVDTITRSFNSSQPLDIRRARMIAEFYRTVNRSLRPERYIGKRKEGQLSDQTAERIRIIRAIRAPLTSVYDGVRNVVIDALKKELEYPETPDVPPQTVAAVDVTIQQKYAQVHLSLPRTRELQTIASLYRIDPAREPVAENLSAVFADAVRDCLHDHAGRLKNLPEGSDPMAILQSMLGQGLVKRIQTDGRTSFEPTDDIIGTNVRRNIGILVTDIFRKKSAIRRETAAEKAARLANLQTEFTRLTAENKAIKLHVLPDGGYLMLVADEEPRAGNIVWRVTAIDSSDSRLDSIRPGSTAFTGPADKWFANAPRPLQRYLATTSPVGDLAQFQAQLSAVRANPQKLPDVGGKNRTTTALIKGVKPTKPEVKPVGATEEPARRSPKKGTGGKRTEGKKKGGEPGKPKEKRPPLQSPNDYAAELMHEVSSRLFPEATTAEELGKVGLVPRVLSRESKGSWVALVLQADGESAEMEVPDKKAGKSATKMIPVNSRYIVPVMRIIGRDGDRLASMPVPESGKIGVALFDAPGETHDAPHVSLAEGATIDVAALTREQARALGIEADYKKFGHPQPTPTVISE